MNSAISFLVGCLTFVIVMVIKIPIKKINMYYARKKYQDAHSCYAMYKHCNIVLFPIIGLVSLIIYYIFFRTMALDHFKFCCTLKAAAIAVALYAVYDQLLGTSHEPVDESHFPGGHNS